MANPGSTYPPFSRPRGNPLALVFAGAAFALAAYLVLDRTGVFSPTASAEPRTVTPRGELAASERSLVDLFDAVSPSVAHINTSSLVRTTFGVAEQKGSGSGFVWDAAGIIVTNDHVVRGAREVSVSVGGSDYRALVLNSSPNHDLAVLKLRGPVRNLTPIALGTSADLRVGQTAIAIGNPFGFDQTMTTGVISALNRTLKTEEKRLMHGLIQVDAAINPGNSGGPLLDSAGRLVGVTTAIYSPSGANAGLGFAVPVDTVNEIVPRLLADKPTTAVLGVRTNFERLSLDPQLGYRSGAIVTDIVDGYGAAAAGLKPFRVSANGTIREYGDVIVEIDGQPVRAFSELPRVLSSRKPGDSVKVKAIRGLPDAPEAVVLDVQLAAMGEGVDLGM